MYFNQIKNLHLSDGQEWFENTDETSEIIELTCSTNSKPNEELPEEEIAESHEKNEQDNKKWSDGAVRLLLDTYVHQEAQFSTGEIANKINHVNSDLAVTGIQCSMKMSGLKRTYKGIIDHNRKTGNNKKTWVHFSYMDEKFGKKGWISPPSVASTDPKTDIALVDEASSSSDLFTVGSTSNADTSIKCPLQSKKRVRDVLKEYIENSKKEKLEKKCKNPWWNC